MEKFKPTNNEFGKSVNYQNILVPLMKAILDMPAAEKSEISKDILDKIYKKAYYAQRKLPLRPIEIGIKPPF